MFRSYRDLVRTPQTLKDDSVEEYYSCDLCSQGKWVTETDVEIHRKCKHLEMIQKQIVDNKERFCTICMKLQPNYSQLISHIKTDHLYSSPTSRRIAREIFICNYCHNLFFNRNLLELHIMYWHLYPGKERKTRIYKCPKCQRKLKLNFLWYHFILHEAPSISFCDICITNFKNRRLLAEHVKTHPYYFKCDPCGYNTHKEALFDAHLESHNYKKVTKVSSRCLKEAFKVHKWHSKIYNIHHVLKGLYVPKIIDICILCREICTDKLEMRSHLLKDHLGLSFEVEKKANECACGEGFDFKVLLKQHVLKLGGNHRALEEGERISDIMDENNEILANDQENRNTNVRITCNPIEGDMLEITVISEEFEKNEKEEIVGI